MKTSISRAFLVIPLLVLVFSAPVSRGADINVACNTAALIAAINAANGTPEADTLNLTAGCLYSFMTGDATFPDSALPQIATPITINGSGATLERAGSSPDFRLLYVHGAGDLVLKDLTVSGGESSAGGGVLNASKLTVIRSTFAGNSGGSGGAIYNVDGSLTMIDSIVSGNSADNYAGGIYNNINSTATMIDSVIAGNTANFGGGIYTIGLFTVINSTISGNSVTFGGGIYLDSGTLTVINSTLSGNTANNLGGGILNDLGTLTVANSTLSGNSAATGGGLSLDSGTSTVTNTIVWGNSTQISGVATVTFSIVEGGFAGTDNLNADPLFVSPVTHTLAPTTDGDYHVQVNSPALNAGSNAALPEDTFDLDGDTNTVEPIPFDRDGSARVVGTVDMGAYEIQPAELLTNSGFESALDGWTVKFKTGDKRTCKPGKALSGLCAFKFKGATGEKAQLAQTVDLTGVTLQTGDTLSLSAWFKGNNATAKTKVELTVTYASGPVKKKLTVKRNAAYTQHALPDYALTSGAVDEIKVTFKHKSTAGSVLIDDVSLIHTPGGARTRTGAPLPPPSAPEGFRGAN